MGVPNGRLKSKKWQKSQKEDVMEGIGEPSAGVFLTTRSEGVGRLSGETVANREAVTKRSFAKPEG